MVDDPAEYSLRADAETRGDEPPHVDPPPDGVIAELVWSSMDLPGMDPADDHE